MRPAVVVVPGFVPGDLASGVFALASVKISTPRGGATFCDSQLGCSYLLAGEKVVSPG